MNSVVKKSIVAVTGALALIVAGGSSVHAYTSWQGGKGVIWMKRHATLIP